MLAASGRPSADFTGKAKAAENPYA